MFIKQPSSLKDIKIHKDVMESLTAYLASDDFPHFLLYGPSGTGKTTIANCFINDLLKNTRSYNCLSMNASNTRGIDAVRQQIDQFAKHKAINGKFRIILLDEADYLTQDAKAALRGIMQTNKKTCKFILTCNAIDKIGSAILSRCAKFNILPLTTEELKKVLNQISVDNKLELSDEHITKLIGNSNGDIRYILQNILTDPSNTYNPFEVGKALIQGIADKNIKQVIFKYKLTPDLVINFIFNYVQYKEFPLPKYIQIIEKLATLDDRIKRGCNEFLQIELVSLSLRDLLFD